MAQHHDPTQIFDFGPFQLSVAARRLQKGDQAVEIGDRAFDLLATLVDRAGQIVEKADLMRGVWPDVYVDEGALRVTVGKLREALEDGQGGARYIVNVRGRGYCFVADVSRPPRAGGGRRIIGREEAVRELSEKLSRHRLVSIVGPGGIGKTTVAQAVADRMLAAGGGAPTCFVDLGVLTDASLVAGHVASALGLQGGSDPALDLLAYLHGRKLLVVLDSCEHVVDAAATLAEQIVSRTAHVQVLSTSREPLRADGEQIYRLPSLSLPPDDARLTAQDAMRYPAVQLLVERVAATRHDFVLTDAEADLAADVCRRLDGIALAIELASASIGTVGLPETVSLLDTQSSLRWTGRRTAMPRQHTLHGTLDWSYSLLTAQEQRLFRHLSVFVGPFSREDVKAAVAFDNDIGDLLGKLVAKSLVAVSTQGDETRFRLLDMARLYARTKLTESGEEAVVARRHAEWLLQLVDGRVPGDRPFGDPRDLEVVRSQIKNLRAALPWCLSNPQDHRLGVDLVTASAPAFLELGLWKECGQWTKQAMGLVPLEDMPLNQALELLISHAQAELLFEQFYPALQEKLLQALELAEGAGHTYYRMRALIGLHRYLVRSEDFSASLAAAETMFEVARSIGSADMSAIGALLMGISRHYIGDQGLAHELLSSGLARVKFFGAVAPVRFTHHTDFYAMVCLARASWLIGLPEQAMRTARQCLDVADALRSTSTIGLLALFAIQVYFWSGQWERARSMAEGLLDLTERAPQAFFRRIGEPFRGELLLRKGDLEDGLPLLSSFLQFIAAEGRHSIMPMIAFSEGLMETGQWEEAQNVLAAAVEFSRERNHHLYMPELLRLQGECLAVASAEAAEARFQDALALARAQSARSWELRAALSLARLALRQGLPADQATAPLAEVFGAFSEGLGTKDLLEARALLDATRS